MSNLDELSRVIGNIEGTLKELKDTQDKQWKKLEKIESYIIHNKITVTGLAASISTIITVIIAIIKEWWRK